MSISDLEIVGVMITDDSGLNPDIAQLKAAAVLPLRPPSITTSSSPPPLRRSVRLQNRARTETKDLLYADSTAVVTRAVNGYPCTRLTDRW